MRRVVCTLVLTLASALPAAAWAQPSADVQRAQELFKRGQALMEAHKVHEACDKFDESQRLEPTLGTLLNLADCHVQDGKLASAWRELGKAIELAVVKDRKERERFARAQRAEIEPRLGFVHVQVSPDTRLDRMELDGVPVPSEEWQWPIAVDPGEHRLAVHAPRKKERVVSFRASSGAHGTLSVELEDEGPAAQAPPPPARIPPPGAVGNTAPVERAPAGGGPKTRIAGYVVGGVGVVALGLGGYFGLRTLSKKSDSDAFCSTSTTCEHQAGIDLRDQAKTAATVSTVAFAAGIVAVAVGIYLVVTAKDDAPTPAAWLARPGTVTW